MLEGQHERLVCLGCTPGALDPARRARRNFRAMGLFSKIFGSDHDEDTTENSKSAGASTAQPERNAAKSQENAPQHTKATQAAAADARPKMTSPNTEKVAPPPVVAAPSAERSATKAAARQAPGSRTADPSSTRKAPAAPPPRTPAGRTAPNGSRPTAPRAGAANRTPARRALGGTRPGVGPQPSSKQSPASKTPSGTSVRPQTAKVSSTAALPPLQLDIEPAPKAAPRATPSASTPEIESTPLRRPSARPEDLLHWTDADEDIDTAFTNLESKAPNSKSPGGLAEDPATRAQNLELFTQLAMGYARPLRDFVLEISVGETTAQWLDVVRPALKGIRQGAAEFGDPALGDALRSLERAVDRARNASAAQISKAHRESILGEYQKLAQAWPAVFDVKEERARREPIVVHQLLLQVHGVHKVALDRLYAAGLHDLEAYCRTTVDDLMGLAGVSREVAEAVRARFAAYWKSRTDAGGPVEERARAELGRVLGELSAAHDAFQRAELSEDRSLKRNARSARQACTHQVNVLLAEMGAVDLVKELERVATAQRIERVREYIREKSGPVQARG